MIMEKFQEAKNLIEQSQNITVLPSPEFQKDSFPAALGLFYSLKKLGKNVKLLAENYPARFEFLVDGKPAAETNFNFLLSIKEVGAEFSELFYEKTTDGLNLFLKTKGGELTKENICLQPLRPQNPLYLQNATEDLLITIGIARPEKAEMPLAQSNIPILNIDIDPKNEAYGEANLIVPVAASFSEIVFDVICQDERSLLDEQSANCLLAGIIYATQNLQNPRITAQALEKISCLSKIGASLPIIREALYGVLEKGALAIFFRLLNKMQLDEQSALAWAVLGLKDFEETGSSPKNLRLALQKLASGAFPLQNFLVLWEQASSPIFVRGVFYSPNRDLVEKMWINFEGERKGDGVLFRVEALDLVEAKDRVLEALSR